MIGAGLSRQSAWVCTHDWYRTIIIECNGAYTWDIPCSSVKPHPSFQENSHEQNLGKGQTLKEWKAQAQ